MITPVKITMTDLDGTVLGIYDLSLLDEDEVNEVPDDIARDIKIYSSRARRGVDLATGRETIQ